MVFNLQPPSSFLPHIKGIKTCSHNEIAKAIARLKDIYIHPQVRGSTRRRSQRPTGSSKSLLGHNSTPSDHDPTLISTDAFERSFSIQWLTRFISISSELTFRSENEVAWGADTLEQAAALLAVCAGAAASGTIERVLTFPFTPPVSRRRRTGNPVVAAFPGWDVALNKVDEYAQQNDFDEIRVILRDAPLESADFSSVGAQTWGGSCVLAEMLAETPEAFGVIADSMADGITIGHKLPPFRALELGAGTGLASLVLGKILERLRLSDPQFHSPREAVCLDQAAQRDLDIVVATDFHPSVLANLRGNVETNFPPDTSSPVATPPGSVYPVMISAPGPQVVVLPLDWSLVHDLACAKRDTSGTTAASPDCDQFTPELSAVPSKEIADLPSLFDMPFDLIIGADIIYEPLHAKWVRSCVECFLRKPGTSPRHATASFTSSSTTEVDLLKPALFHLIIPLRRTHSSESRTVDDVFPHASEVTAARLAANHAISAPIDSWNSEVTTPLTSSSVPVLAVVSQEDIECDAYLDTEGTEEVVYRYYTIGWV